MKNKIKPLAMTAIIAFSSVSYAAVGKDEKQVNIEASKVVWKGYKVTGSHEGTIQVKEGELEFEGDTLIGGSFIMDMTTIGSTDLQGDYKGKLDGHLKSDDFFGVEKYPTASLVFTDVKATGKNSYEITGDITIKGTTETITFDLSVYGSKANASLKIDRSKFDVRYGSTSFFDGLKDKAIYDEFDIVADLEF
ncbi:YceI family protein [Yeosuana sp. MJ-SS3]|uniref:YceI family protein n=1 Tax=Gilvirhabdus luticola TaxID=3079858 RepID=A0ABU3U2U1_9FLAO|nr:YceI family protein [Yeosuana sp. MJ-SS3]MDU8884724.1 YceI family protein [Yeosuana sp. MJ-SS3]